ncbi:peptidoglycan DD-metalloendopeptidase family protein [Dethiothermospora halolimnae]|uniref:peptidoglycan DD-metalloendopeptidase family protein n=1 Tax=Dethiothermospora halolimnae TaxID=3114390 RepID=UPI003CCBDF3D
MDEFNNNNNNDNKNNKNKEKKWTKLKSNLKHAVRKIGDKDGFYIILFICVCIVGTTAVWVSKNNVDKISDNNKSGIELVGKNEDSNIVKGHDEYVDEFQNNIEPEAPLSDNNKKQDKGDKINKTKIKETKEEMKETKDNKNNNKATKEEIAKANKEQKTNSKSKEASTNVNTKKEIKTNIKANMIMPLIGKVSKEYTIDNLVYSKTLEQWSAHKGIDIKGREGSVVRAALDGIVSEKRKDPLYGIVIVIDHENGLETVYANVSTMDMVEVGQRVNSGDAISGIGKSKGIELADGPHLHFEVLENGEKVDPKKYLPDTQ